MPFLVPVALRGLEPAELLGCRREERGRARRDLLPSLPAKQSPRALGEQKQQRRHEDDRRHRRRYSEREHCIHENDSRGRNQEQHVVGPVVHLIDRRRERVSDI